MSRVAQRALHIGDRVRSEGRVLTLVGTAGTTLLLADGAGQVERVAMTVLLSRDDFVVVGQSAEAAGPPRLGGLHALDGLPEEVVKRALWWERHILDVLQSDSEQGYGSLASREAAKAAELTAAGHAVTARTVKHYRQRYEAAGREGLLDHRADKQMPAFGRTDTRVVEAMRQVVAETVNASTRTIGFLIWRTGVVLEEQYGPGAVPMPSQRTCYRLFAKLMAGTHASGSATTRRSLASRPEGPFGQVTALAPGEQMQMDSTQLDVLVLLADGVSAKCEMTGLVDVATRSVTAVVLRPSAKSVDATVLLARTLTPETMRPGWPAALAMSRSVLPWRRLVRMDERLEHAAARPVMVPETIVVDHGKVFVSGNFRDACRFLGINLQPARKATPTDKGHIESMLGSVATLFAQFVAGYTGAHPDRRGRHLERERLWSLPELQDLLDEWIVTSWQNRPHDALRDPSAPGRAFTPNQRYAALVEAAGYVPVAMSGTDYVELLPALWRRINAYGVKVGHRTYDDAALNPLRRQDSGLARHGNLWEIRYDPYDISRIWIRDHRAGTWITAFWKHLNTGAAPFGELTWNHVAAQMPGADEAAIAEAAGDLLRRAHAGPQLDARDRRVAAQQRAAGTGTQPRPPAPEPQAADDPVEASEADGQTPVPFDMLDPWQEARTLWR